MAGKGDRAAPVVVEDSLRELLGSLYTNQSFAHMNPQRTKCGKLVDLVAQPGETWDRIDNSSTI